MSLINQIYAPKETVNDEFLSIVAINYNSGDFVDENVIIAEVESSKAIVEIFSECSGYIKHTLNLKDEVKVGELLFEFYKEPIEDVQIRITDSTISNTSQIQKTIFSKKAVEFIAKNNIDKNKYSNVKFVTTKDLIPKSTTKENQESILRKSNLNEILSNEDESYTVEISSTKKREADYLYSVNSSSVISRLSVAINIKDKKVLAKCQHFIKTTPLPTILLEVSRLLLKYPNLNSYYKEAKQVFYNNIHVGFALDDGKKSLKVASILNTNELTLIEIEEKISDLSIKYSNNKLDFKDLSSSTFTISDLFNTNIISFSPLVNINNAAILGISSLVNDQFIIDLTFDHRITSGKEVSDFLSDLKFRLEARFDI